MKQKLLNFTRLRSLVLLAVITFLGAGQAWGDEVTFTFSSLASSNSWSNGTAYTPVVISPITLSAEGGGNNGKYYTSDTSWRMYNGGTVNITAADGYTITDVSSNPSQTFTISNGSASLSCTATIKFKSITVTYTTSGGSQTETCATPTFSPVAGTYTSAQNVTISSETTGATIYYTTDGSAPTTSSNVYSSAIPVSATTTIKAIAVKDGNNNSSVASATYTILNLEHAGTEQDPYTVADARAAIDANTGFTNVYVTGIVSEIVTAYNSSYGNISYNISSDGETTSDQLEAFRGKSYNGDNFTSADDIQVGDVVVVKGDLTKYNSTYELAADNQLVSLQRTNTTPSINANDVEIAYDATSGEIAYTITNPADGVSLTASSTADWISNITVGANSVTFTTTSNNGTTDRTATITLSYTGATDKVVTVTQGHYVADYATLPFEFDGGKADIESTAGLTQEGLGNDYADSNAPLKFDGQGDYVILKINERPGTLSFNIKNNSFSGGTFTVQTSEDGTIYTDHKSYTEITGTQAEEIDNLGENVRYIKWIYTTKSTGNVGLGNISLTAYGATPTYTLSWTAGEGTELFVFDAADTSNPLTSGDPLAEGTTIQVSVVVSSGYTFESLVVKDANNDDVTVTEPVNEDDPYEFTMPASNVTITSTATASSTPTPVTGSNMFVKVTSTSDITDGKYLIVYEDGNVAFDGGRDNDTEKLDAASNTIAVTIDNGTIASNATTNAAVFTIDATNGTIQSASGFYIGQTNDANGLLANANDESAYTNTISISNGDADIVSSGGAYMRYNSNSGQTRFRYFKSSTYTGQKAIQLYKFVYAPTSLTLNSAGYATFASTSAVDFSDDSEFSAWQITEIDNNNTITFSQITGTVAAGTGVLLKGSSSASIDLVYATSGDELTDNLLVGTTFSTPVENDQFYGLSGNTFVKVNAGTVPAGKALLPAGEVSSGSGVKAFTFVFEDATGIKTVEQVSAEQAAEIFNLAGQRLNKMQRGVNIVNGKKVLVK